MAIAGSAGLARATVSKCARRLSRGWARVASRDHASAFVSCKAQLDCLRPSCTVSNLWTTNSDLTRRVSSTAYPGDLLANPLDLPAEVFASRSVSEHESSAATCLFYSDWADMQLPDKHRFPIDKYRHVRFALAAEGQALLKPGPLATYEEACLAHEPAYVRSILTGDIAEKERKRVGFAEAPLRNYVVRSLASLGATVAATRACLSASRPGSFAMWSGAISGGTHHAFANAGEGFCVFNDCAVAARIAQTEFGIDKVLILDLDVHQGNGSAKIFEDDPSVFTLSAHQERGYPFSTRCSSDLDIDLPDNCGDVEYLSSLDCLPSVFERVRPGLIVYQAGVDGLVGDRFGRLALSREGLRARNSLVYRLAAERRVPVVATMGGGYHRDIAKTVSCSADVYRQLISENFRMHAAVASAHSLQDSA